MSTLRPCQTCRGKYGGAFARCPTCNRPRVPEVKPPGHKRSSQPDPNTHPQRYWRVLNEIIAERARRLAS